DVGHDRTEHVKNNETITIDNDRLENVKHNETITIDNDRTETVKHDERITIDNDRIELVKNDETVTVENDQHIVVKNNQYEDVEGDKHNKVRGDRLEKITGSSHLKITGSQNEEITSSVSRDTKMNVQEKMGMKYAVDAGTEIHIKAGLSAVIEANVSITLQCNASMININPAGVFIDGPIVLIKSGALAVPGSGSNPSSASNAQGANKAVSRDNPNTEDIEYDGTIGGDNARHPLETEAAPPAIEGDAGIDVFEWDSKEPPEAEDTGKAQCLTDAASNASAFVQKAPPFMPFPFGFFFDSKQSPHSEFNEHPGNQSKKTTIEEERKLIKEAHEQAKPMIDSAIDSLEKAKSTKNRRVRNYFGIYGTTDEDKGKLDKLILNYQSIKLGLDEIDYKVEYNYDGRLIAKGESIGINHPAFAEGNTIMNKERYKEFIPDDKTVHIVFPAFSMGSFNNTDRARTIIHELAHIKIHTVDYAYAHVFEAIDTLSHGKKIRNSGSYGAFATLSHFDP
ncbi:MAG: hypothetical protein L3J59_13380, partial [Methylococcaceae bacterium]|nr:hypothetical protein [Methylococcaceae bacterium]